jgi:hypothetical protein
MSIGISLKIQRFKIEIEFFRSFVFHVDINKKWISSIKTNIIAHSSLSDAFKCIFFQKNKINKKLKSDLYLPIPMNNNLLSQCGISAFAFFDAGPVDIGNKLFYCIS